MPQFTRTVEAHYASELRAKRDRSDADIAREYRFTSVTAKEMPKTIREDRAVATRTRNMRIREAIESALNSTVLDVQDADLALDNATFSVSVKDLHATVTITLPDSE